jgi:NADH-quinone oxidoreductase subunit M
MAGVIDFSIENLLRSTLPLADQRPIFALFLVAIAIRMPLFPFHGWLEGAIETRSIAGVSVFLVGVKPAAYALLRFTFPVFPEAAHEASTLLVVVGGAGMVYGAMIALVQTDLRRLLVFGSVSHMGIVVVAFASLNEYAFTGALMQSLNLGIAITGLFFLAAFLHQRFGSTDLAAMGGGLVGRVPKLALAFLVIALGGIGMPGTSGFNGEHMMMLGALHAHWAYAGVIGVSIFLTAVYLLTAYQRAFLSRVSGTPTPVVDLSRQEMFIVGCVTALVLGTGLVSSPFTRVMTPSVRAVTEHVRVHDVRRPWLDPKSSTPIRVDGRGAL